MELYVLNEAYTPVEVFDDHITLSWIERFDEQGEFSITVDNTEVNKNRFHENMWLGMDESSRVMEVRSIREVDNGGNTVLEISGPSHESILEGRTMVIFAEWKDTASELARRAFQETMVTTPYVEDRLAYYDPYNFYGPGGLLEDDELLDIEVHGDNLMGFIQSLCQLKSLGYRLVRVPKQPKVQFHVYTGTNRTIKQTSVPPIVFDPRLDTLVDVATLNSIESYYNVAYVVDSDLEKHVISAARAGQALPTGDNIKPLIVKVTDTSKTIRDADYMTWLIAKGRAELAKPANASKNVAIIYPHMPSSTLVILPEGETVQPKGVKRRVLHVNPSEVDAEIYSAAYPKLAATYGRTELAKYKREFLIEGEIPSDSPYVYEKDYFLGDIVTFKSPEGEQNMRVVEQVFSDDETGPKRYPTLRKEDVWRSDVWSSQPENLYWDNATGTWDEQ